MSSSEDAAQERRNDFDVTNTVQVSSPREVRRAVRELFTSLYPSSPFDAVWLGFHDFERLYGGFDPEYHGIDTAYHDMQHSLDMTLALARLVAGYEQSVPPGDRLGPERAMLAIVAALFHDSGYLRHKVLDRDAANGAEFTLTHVTRSGRFLERYLPQVGLGDFVPVISRIVHFTGYEIPLDRIVLEEPKDFVIGRLLGTADLVAQLADRCYLEKCRDRLFPEFVLGGVAFDDGRHAGAGVRYRSGRDLLGQTLKFYQSSVHLRLERGFNGAYRYLEAYFGGEQNPYVFFIRKNLRFLTRVLERDAWDQLRRRPPCVIPDPYGEARLMALALRRVREWNEVDRERRKQEPNAAAPATAEAQGAQAAVV
ncbi:MAG TPA: hypothetical protein VFV10_08735 [Gammaproteobacteria bacterium]|nr:hypothetical protein [Gammaproteobacteria bacterium]